jgi:hypothetical protein
LEVVKYLLEAGGKEFSYIPCLNERDDWIKALDQNYKMKQQDLAIMTDGSMTWKPRADPSTTVTAEMDGSWRFERDGVTVRKGKAEDGSAINTAISAYNRWLAMWLKRREIREAQEALHNEHCIPKEVVYPGKKDGV